jgi:hypothetical protein
VATAVASMLLPLAGYAGIVGLVWLRLYQLRIGEMQRSRIHPQKVALSARKEALLLDTRASDNFRNLFEMPVLFCIGVLVVAAAQLQDPIFVAAAWVYVALRAIHSAIQCTYNRVMHRFGVYAVSSIVLFAFWMRLGWMLAG